jgi:Leucine-rich repeat (LRR) protein
MKNLIFTMFLVLFFFSLETTAQTTSIPDNNFEQALIDLGHDSGAIDGLVTTANISSLTYLDVYNKGISSLTGIEDFTALTTLYCTSNSLTSLDVSSNTALTRLYCSYNSLTSLDVSSNTALTTLYCQSNSLTSLDVSSNTSLDFLDCGNNNLTSLDVSSNTALTELWCQSNSLTSLDVSSNTALTSLSCYSNSLTSLNVKNGNNINFPLGFLFNATNNPSLVCIEVDDVAYSTANWTDIDAGASYSSDCYNTSIPDPVFEQALIDLGHDSGPIDGLVTTSNISSLTFLNVYNKGISSLTGIEDFTALTILYCDSNSLTSLDVSSNTALTTLVCRSNSLTSLDVSSNTALTELYCSSNSLTSLDVSSNIALTTLWCYSNSLTSLDVSGNTALTSLDCESNSLTSLDVSNNIDLTYLWCSSNSLTSLNVKNGNNTNFTYFNAATNPDLFCIEVDDVAYSTTNWTDIDAGASYDLDCYNTSIPDNNFEQSLIDQGLDSGAIDGLVTTANISSLTTLHVTGIGISSLTGIEDFTSLTELYCNSNSLTSLDVSSNIALTTLWCFSNNLTSLDVSNNTALTFLNCYNNDLTSLNVSSNTALTTLSCNSNSLTSLDVSSNTALTVLRCQSNSLTSLNVKNGNNTNFTYFNAATNPDLFCIEVDDVAYSTTYWTDIDPGASYSLDCSALSVEVIEINNFSLYPNPVKDYLNISLNEGLELKRATIYNTLGQFIFSTENLKINTSNIASGIYYIEVETNKGKSTKKILID